MNFEIIPWARVLTYLFLSTFFLGNISSYLKIKFLINSGYTRKINHIGIMLISAPLIAFLPDHILKPTLFVSSILLTVIYIIAAVSKKKLIHGIIFGSLRDRDNPNSKFFFFLPFLTFNIAIALSTTIFPFNIIRVAFFTVAIADGLAEPIGLFFGKNNTYKVKDFIWKRYNTKSIAGSFLVFFASFLICLGFFLIEGVSFFNSVIISIAYGIWIAVVEALSPRGFDNMLLVLFGIPFLYFSRLLFLG